MEFKGNIIITDPMKVFSQSDWMGFISNPEQYPIILGFTKQISQVTPLSTLAPTEYSWEIGDVHTKSKMVSVFLLDELKRYNPNFESSEQDYVFDNFAGEIYFHNNNVCVETAPGKPYIIKTKIDY